MQLIAGVDGFVDVMVRFADVLRCALL